MNFAPLVITLLVVSFFQDVSANDLDRQNPNLPENLEKIPACDQILNQVAPTDPDPKTPLVSAIYIRGETTSPNANLLSGAAITYAKALSTFSSYPVKVSGPALQPQNPQPGGHSIELILGSFNFKSLDEAFAQLGINPFQLFSIDTVSRGLQFRRDSSIVSLKFATDGPATQNFQKILKVVDDYSKIRPEYVAQSYPLIEMLGNLVVERAGALIPTIAARQTPAPQINSIEPSTSLERLNGRLRNELVQNGPSGESSLFSDISTLLELEMEPLRVDFANTSETSPQSSMIKAKIVSLEIRRKWIELLKQGFLTGQISLNIFSAIEI